MEIITVLDEGLGHSSHVVDLGGGQVLVIDPARLPERQRLVAVERGWNIAWTADTHSHADYISGSFEFAAGGARFLAPSKARLEVEHHGVEPTRRSKWPTGSCCERSRHLGTPPNTWPTCWSATGNRWGCSPAGR